MSTIPIEDQQSINEIDLLVTLKEQDNRLKLARVPMEHLAHLYINFAGARQSNDASNLPVFEKLVEYFQECLLYLLPEAIRDSTLAVAVVYVENRFNDKGELGQLAKLEVLLSKLHLLCLNAAASNFSNDVRSKEWNGMIEAANNHLESAESDWATSFSSDL